MKFIAMVLLCVLAVTEVAVGQTELTVRNGVNIQTPRTLTVVAYGFFTVSDSGGNPKLWQSRVETVQPNASIGFELPAVTLTRLVAAAADGAFRCTITTNRVGAWLVTNSANRSTCRFQPL